MIRTLSSVWLERSAHNRVVDGSNPSGSICGGAENYVQVPEVGIESCTRITAPSPPHREKRWRLSVAGSSGSVHPTLRNPTTQAHKGGRLGQPAYPPLRTRSSVWIERQASNASGMNQLLYPPITTRSAAGRRNLTVGSSNLPVSVRSPVVSWPII